MTKEIVATDVMNFMGELTARIKAHPHDEHLLAEARAVLAKLDDLAATISTELVPE